MSHIWDRFKHARARFIHISEAHAFDLLEFEKNDLAYDELSKTVNTRPIMHAHTHTTNRETAIRIKIATIHRFAGRTMCVHRNTA